MKEKCRFYFFPYMDETRYEQLKSNCKKNDVVIFYFPGVRAHWVKDLKKKGVKVIAYISIFKVPVIEEVLEATGFNGGSVPKEEVLKNPYWKKISLDLISDKTEHRITLTKKGELARPFGKINYKKGWYQSCLMSLDFESKVLHGICDIFKQLGVNGVFIDNIISNLNDCYYSECRKQNMQEKRLKILSSIYNRIKKIDKKNLVYINVGRNPLYDARIPADVYVTENFCYGDTTSTASLYFAGHVYNQEENLINDIIKLKENILSNVGAKLLGYTKLHGALPSEEIGKCLQKSMEVALKCDILWSFRLTRCLDLRKEWQHYQKLHKYLYEGR